MPRRLTTNTLIMVFALGLIMYSCKEDVKEPEVEDEVAEEDPTLKYVGTWNSSTSTGAEFNDVGISAKVLELVPGSYRGNLWISTNYTSCCGSGESDGSIKFDIVGDSVLNFGYNDVIPNCEGNFVGVGVIDDEQNLIITITGNDCDGDHIGELFFDRR